MYEQPTSQAPSAAPEDATADSSEMQAAQPAQQDWRQIWENLVRLGLGEVALRIGTGLSSIVLILLVIWVMGNFYLNGQIDAPREAVMAAGLPTPVSPILPPDFTPQSLFSVGVPRLAVLHTTLPSLPRFDVSTYEVQKGDTIFGIAEKFNLKPETILWGNYHILADDPHRLRPGQKLNILPVNGVYYKWNAGDGLTAVSKYFSVQPEDIVAWPGNHFDADKIGDYANPNIAADSWVIIPGGRREFITWSAPRITRDNPGVAKIMGPGFCGTVTDGAMGVGTFIWPSTEKYLSGYDYSTETNHFGIDIGGKLGNPIFATDNGVVVYSGWNNWGYGNVVVVDHGNGWQSLYAHLQTILVSCGASVYQGGTIGYMGSTGNSSGPHLHFELRSDKYGRPNPWDYLQK